MPAISAPAGFGPILAERDGDQYQVIYLSTYTGLALTCECPGCVLDRKFRRTVIYVGD